MVQPTVDNSFKMLLDRIRERSRPPTPEPEAEAPEVEEFGGETRDISKLVDKIDKLKDDKEDKPKEKEIVYVPQIVEKYVYVTPPPQPAPPAAPIVIHIPAQQQKPMYHPPQKRPC